MSGYFHCNGCGCDFTDPAQERTGVSYAGYYEMESVCPTCGSGDYDEGSKCSICGEWFDSTKATLICDECRKQAATLDVAAEYGKTHLNDDGLNPVLLFIALGEYGSVRLNEMLFKSIKDDNRLYERYNLDDDFGTKYIDPYLSEDYSAFDDWYLDRLEKQTRQM